MSPMQTNGNREVLVPARQGERETGVMAPLAVVARLGCARASLGLRARRLRGPVEVYRDRAGVLPARSCRERAACSPRPQAIERARSLAAARLLRADRTSSPAARRRRERLRLRGASIVHQYKLTSAAARTKRGLEHTYLILDRGRATASRTSPAPEFGATELTPIERRHETWFAPHARLRRWCCSRAARGRRSSSCARSSRHEDRARRRSRRRSPTRRGARAAGRRRRVRVRAARQVPLDVREAVRAADRRRRRARVDLRRGPEPGHRAQARRRARRDARRAAGRATTRRGELHADASGRRPDGLEWRRRDAEVGGDDVRRDPPRLSRQRCRARWSSTTRSARRPSCASRRSSAIRRCRRRCSGSRRRRAPTSSGDKQSRT